MKNPRVVEAVLKASHKHIGIKVECRLAYPKERKGGKFWKLFIGGLAPEVTQSEFDQYFSRYGNIEDSVVMREKATGKARGFGFVTFSSERSVESVIRGYDNHSIRGQWIECKLAKPKEEGMKPPMSPVSTTASSSMLMSEIDSEEICMSVIHGVLDDENDWEV